MAVALGTGTTFTSSAAALSFTFSHTVTAGTDCLSVRVGGWFNTGQVSGVTYGGVAMTNVGRTNNATGNDHAEVWRLLSPASGAANVVMTITVSVDGLLIRADNLTGVNAAAPTGTYVSATGSTGNPSVVVTASSGDLVFDALGADNSAGGTLVVDASQAQQFNAVRNGEWGAGSSETGAASVTMSWARSTNSTWALGSVAFKASGGGGATPSRLAILGVG